MRTFVRVLMLLALMAAVSPAMAQAKSEELSFPQQHRGKAITVAGALFLPAGTGKVPALVIHHGSGGVSDDREVRYAREIVKLGVAAYVIDSFKPRGVTSTVKDQTAVTGDEMLSDAFAALKALAGHARIDGKRVGIVGFSKGGQVALYSAHATRAARFAPEGHRFALHVPFYPWCGTQYYKPKMTGAPIYMLIGGADTYVGVKPCQDYAAALKETGAPVEVVVYPGAKHGFDGGRDYNVPDGQNSSRCVFAQQADGTFKEQYSGIVTTDAQGRRIDAEAKKAMAKCTSKGVSGGPNQAARDKSMAALKSYVQRHLIDAK